VEVRRGAVKRAGISLRAKNDDGKMAEVARIQDIAQQLGVSISTVSRALSGSRLVGEEVRAEVERVAGELAYTRRPRRRRRGVVNLRVVTDPVQEGVEPSVDLALLLAGLREGLAGRMLNLFCDEAGPDYDPFLHKKGGDIDALVFAQREPEAALLECVRRRDVPLVIVNAVIDGCACVAPDHLDGIDRLVGHLAERIEEFRPCLVFADEAGSWNHEMREAMVGACVRREVEFEPDRDAGIAPDAVAARCSAVGWNAAVCGDFLTAAAVLSDLSRVGIAVPSRVSVACFGDSPVRKLLRPSPVAVAVSGFSLGRRAAALIDHWLAGGERQPLLERVTGSLVAGDAGARSAR